MVGTEFPCAVGVGVAARAAETAAVIACAVNGCGAGAAATGAGAAGIVPAANRTLVGNALSVLMLVSVHSRKLQFVRSGRKWID